VLKHFVLLNGQAAIQLEEGRDFLDGPVTAASRFVPGVLDSDRPGWVNLFEDENIGVQRGYPQEAIGFQIPPFDSYLRARPGHIFTTLLGDGSPRFLHYVFPAGSPDDLMKINALLAVRMSLPVAQQQEEPQPVHLETAIKIMAARPLLVTAVLRGVPDEDKMSGMLTFALSFAGAILQTAEGLGEDTPPSPAVSSAPAWMSAANSPPSAVREAPVAAAEQNAGDRTDDASLHAELASMYESVADQGAQGTAGVELIYPIQLRMPDLCACCGATPAKFTAHTNQLYHVGNQRISFGFPYCGKCVGHTRAAKEYDGPGQWGMLVLMFAGLIAGIAFSTKVLGETGNVAIFLALVGCGAGAGAPWVLKWLSRHLGARSHEGCSTQGASVLALAAHGGFRFQFTNSTFDRAFRTMNHGRTQEELNQLMGRFSA